jgi:hypothetical protein
LSSRACCCSEVSVRRNGAAEDILSCVHTKGAAAQAARWSYTWVSWQPGGVGHCWSCVRAREAVADQQQKGFVSSRALGTRHTSPLPSITFVDVLATLTQQQRSIYLPPTSVQIYCPHPSQTKARRGHRTQHSLTSCEARP